MLEDIKCFQKVFRCLHLITIDIFSHKYTLYTQWHIKNQVYDNLSIVLTHLKERERESNVYGLIWLWNLVDFLWCDMQAMITTSTTVSKDISLIQNNEVFSQTSVLIICGDEEIDGLVICLLLGSKLKLTVMAKNISTLGKYDQRRL